MDWRRRTRSTPTWPLVRDPVSAGDVLAALELAESLDIRDRRAGIDALDRALAGSVADRPTIDVATPAAE